MQTGDLALVDETRPFELGFHGTFRHLTIEIPHHVLGPRLADVHAAAGLVLDGSRGIGRLVSQYVQATSEMVANDDPVAGDALGNHLIDLFALAFGATAEAERRASPCLEEVRLQSVTAFLERHLGDPSLSPGSVATSFRISTRYLHQLFEPRGETLMQWVLRRRVERCRDDLANPEMRARTITDIAFAWGFSDLSHFGRSFKAAFGETPRELRRRMRTSNDPTPAPQMPTKTRGHGTGRR